MTWMPLLTPSRALLMHRVPQLGEDAVHERLELASGAQEPL